MNRRLILLSALSLSLFLSGCAADQAVSAIQTADMAAKVGPRTVAGPLSSAAAARGVAAGTAAGARALLNPGAALATGVAMANSQANMRRNEAAAGRMANMVANSDRIESGLRHLLVVAYNRENGTHFKTYQEMQDHVDIEGYNKQFGTHYKTYTEIRKDFNRRKGMHFHSNEELRKYFHPNQS